MVKEFYVIKTSDNKYYTGHPTITYSSVSNPMKAINFKSAETAKEYIDGHQFELNGQQCSVVKIRVTIEEVQE